MEPLVSVIIPAYNAERWLRTAVQSALEQTVREIEVIVIDDGSSDQTARIVDDIDDERLCVLKHPYNRGTSAARNTGLSIARGRWVAFLDADDAWLPNRLEKLLTVANAHQNAFVSDYLFYCATGSDGKLIPMWSTRRQYRELADPRMPFRLEPHTFVKKRLSLKPMAPLHCIRGAGLFFPEEVPYAEDFAFWMGLYRIGLECWVIPEATYLYRMSPGSMSTRLDRCAWELRVIKDLLDGGGFDSPTIAALVERVRETERLEAYVGFTTALKRGRVSDATKVFFRSPHVLPRFVANIPRAVLFRLLLWGIGGTAR